ncbi:MAG: cob(I)yrinic acid a,c-diamide adenosyltransferase [Phycisphaerales bacterium]|nr:cob(I)yrinic acid a,c-diamide adenosyltransferase [Phycisphaerales bacterium]
MKLYTRTGDDGSTGLFGGPRVGKDDPRVEAYGDVDELNAAVGLAAASCLGAIEPRQPVAASGEVGTGMRRLGEILRQVQSRLFDLGADLATPIGSPHEGKIARIDAADVAEAEAWIDEVDGVNAPMRAFVLPGGSELAARLHLARTICRRAERRTLALSRLQPIHPQGLVLLNRLSALLFALARRANALHGVGDVEWRPKGRG